MTQAEAPASTAPRAPEKTLEPLTLRGVFSSGAVLTILFGGSSFAASRVALLAFTPFGLIATRFAMGSLMLFGFLALRRQKLLPERADLWRTTILGAILGGHLVLQGYALHSTTAISSGWIVGFCPVAIAIGAHLFLRERLPRLAWIGVFVAALGVACVTFQNPPNFADAPLGNLLVFISCFTWTAYTLLAREVVTRNGGVRVSAFALAIAALMLCIVARWTGFLERTPSANEWYATIFLGLCCSGLSFAIWAVALERFGAARLGGLIYYQPFVTLIVTWLWLAEPITIAALIGGPIVVLGVGLMARARRVHVARG